MAPATTSTSTQTPMGSGSVRFLIFYLIIATVLSFYTVYGLWSAQPKVAADSIQTPDCTPPVVAKLTGINPRLVNVGSSGSDVLIVGCGFLPTTQVKFNGTLHPSLVVDASHIRVTLTATDVVAAGTTIITLANGAVDFGSGMLTLIPASVTWQLFGAGPWTISQEVQLLLMVLFTGAFGSCVYSLKSLADYRGDGKLYETWFTYYGIQPFEGAGIAYIMYLVIRGGFLTGTSADVKTVNQFGMCAIAGLSGAFSDTAFLKLREVFQTLFKPQDDRGGKLALKILTTSLPDGAVGTPYTLTLQASGGTTPLKWAVAPALPAGLSLTAGGVIAGTPTAPSPKTTYKFTVTDSATPAATTTADLSLEIKSSGLTITTAALPNGVVGTPYSQTLQASGGTAPLHWGVTPALPAGLSLTAGGVLAGTPTAPSPKTPYTFTATDSATPAASSSATLTLQV